MHIKDGKASHTHTHTHKHAHAFISVLLNNSLMLSIFHARDYYSLPTIPSSWLSCMLTGQSCAIALVQQSAVCVHVCMRGEKNILYLMRVCVCLHTVCMREKKIKIYSAIICVQVWERKLFSSFVCVCVCVCVCMWAKGRGNYFVCVCVCVVVLNLAGVCGWYLQLQQCWSPQRGTSPWEGDSSKLISTHTHAHTHTDRCKAQCTTWGGWGKKKKKTGEKEGKKQISSREIDESIFPERRGEKIGLPNKR